MPEGAKSKRNRKQVDVQIRARRLQVLRLKAAGASVRAIGDQLGVSHTQVERDLKAVLGEMAEHLKGDADALRALMNERYERLLLGWYPLAIGQRTQTEDGQTLETPPSDVATQKVLSILDAMRRMNGIDAAAVNKVEHSTKDDAPLTSVVEVVWLEKPVGDDSLADEGYGDSGE